VIFPASAEEIDVLVFSANTQPWVHTDAISDGIIAIQELGVEENWNVETSVNPADFTDTNLARFDVIVFNNTGGNTLFNITQQAALQTYIRAGGGYVGIHTASATMFNWEWYGELVGAFNNGHPNPQVATLKVEDPSHPSTLGLSNTFDEDGEWFYWRSGTDPRLKEGMKILLSLDGDSLADTQGGTINDSEHPVAWCREFDGGRSFFTVQAHYGDVYEEGYFRTFLAEGIKWAADAVEQDGLLLDLDANKNLELENGDKVARWSNAAPTTVAQDFVMRDEGREDGSNNNTNRGVDLLGVGSGRPTLKLNVAELNGNNSISFVEEELVNLEEDTFDHLSHGSGYTWIAVLSRDQQRWPDQNIRDVNAFFGNLKNGSPFDGIWGGFNSSNRIWSSTRTASATGRDQLGDDWIIGPVLPENEYFIAAARLGSGQGTVTMEMFINGVEAIDAVPVSINPNGNPSKFAIGTERDATNHPGRESFDGEIARFLVYERPLSDLELEQTIETLRLKYLAVENSIVENTLVFDFESGDLQGASVTSGSFGEIVTDKATFNTTGQAYNKEGDYFLSTLEGPLRDGYTGTVTSPQFVLSGPEVSFLIGGGMSSDLAFSIHLADGTEIFSTNRGTNAEPLERRTISLDSYVGETVYWQVTDNSTGGWGYIAVDDIRFDAVSSASNDFESGTLDGVTVVGNFPALLQNRDSYLVPGRYDTPNVNKQGDYFLSTIDGFNGSRSDSYTGTITSGQFVLTDPNASLLVGGGSNENVVYFGIYDASGEELARVANSVNGETFEQVNFNLSEYVGQTIYWQIVDNSTGGWGFITVDDISFNKSAPITFTSQDIGAVAASGSYSTNGGTYTIEGSGRDVWARRDEFHFASVAQSGDGEIIALAESIDNTHVWAKGGVMMRSSFAANSQNVFVFIAPSGKATMQVRSNNNGTTNNVTTGTAVGIADAPKYLSLKREGNTFTGSYSEDGSNWIVISSVNVTMGSDILTGLGVTSHNDGTIAEARFSNVIIDTE